ncbi:MAG: dodecin domain-containing protein [Acidobacteria bacterium]|nr:dodecin domain-containing protein [Acidobacteriota bacterium]
MSVAKNIEITSTSPSSFEDAIEKGIARASKTIDNVRGAWIKDQKINVSNGKATEYQVMMILTFVLDGGDGDDGKSGSGKSSKGKKR